MIAKLSDELALELDRRGDRPLSVEHPRTHRRYVIVPANDDASGGQAARPSARFEEWTEAKNARRFALIDKEIAGQLTFAEADELAQLQREMDDFLQRVAPLPLEAVRTLHEQLVRQSRRGSV
ncbi:MAG TPA: hypothetical protein PLF81_27370 [Candidatus Anammoximicrobium sp.]|nr:hypothetical protein [Candidatus Anammoximicrobium sp.]